MEEQGQLAGTLALGVLWKSCGGKIRTPGLAGNGGVGISLYIYISYIFTYC